MNELSSFMDKQQESGTSLNRQSGKQLKSVAMQKFAGLLNFLRLRVCRFGGSLSRVVSSSVRFDRYFYEQRVRAV